MPNTDQMRGNGAAINQNLVNSNVRKQERGGGPGMQAAEPRPGNSQPQQSVWTQMSINSIMNCSAFSSDQMLGLLNQRSFCLEQSAIIKQANAIDDNLDNGINI